MRFQRIEELIQSEFSSPVHFELEDQSHQHAGRAGTESHFKLFLVSPQFEGLNRIKRQQWIHRLLKAEFDQGLHALTMRLLTEEEFEKQKSEFTTPDCRGGDKL